MEPVTLTARGVCLRPMVEADVPDVVVATQDPQTQLWTTVPTPYGEADARFFVLDYFPRVWSEGNGGLWAVCTPEDQRYGGAMEVRIDPTDPAMADVGFATAPWLRGRGLTAAALRTACEWAVEALGVVRIEWRAYVGNDASLRVAERAGFRLEGVQRSRLVHRGERRDCWVGSVLASDLRPSG